MYSKITYLKLLAFLLPIWLLTGCERSTHVRVEGGLTPVFVISGSGRLASFAVYSPDFAEKAESPWDDNFALWEIKPSGGYFDGTQVGQLERITYGVLPDGYAQVKPQVGSAPALTEGPKYLYYAETTNAPGAAGYLEIRKSQAVPTDGPQPCFGSKDNKWVRVPCLH
jgi:hypothetical protein